MSEPPPDTITALWEAYRALIIAQRDDETLLTDIEHQMKIASAHKLWREAWLAEQQ